MLGNLIGGQIEFDNYIDNYQPIHIPQFHIPIHTSNKTIDVSYLLIEIIPLIITIYIIMVKYFKNQSYGI